MMRLAALNLHDGGEGLGVAGGEAQGGAFRSAFIDADDDAVALERRRLVRREGGGGGQDEQAGEGDAKDGGLHVI
jgi:hypothetical protein